MTLQIREVITASDRKKFVKLQFELYKNKPGWVPPIINDEIHYLDPNKNPAHKHFETKFFIAEKDGKVVGRIGAIINNKYNEKTGKKYIRFAKPEFIDDFEVSEALIKKVEEIGKQNGLDVIHGPLGFTNLDTQGLLIEGFEELQSVASVYHLPYYGKHFEKLGFEKENDWVEFQLKLTQAAFDKASRGAEISKKRYGFEVIKFQDSKQMMQYAPEVFEILNEAFDVLPYVTSLDKELIDFYIHKYFTILNPKYVIVVKKENELAGFQIAVPSMSKALQKVNGKLFPFGFTHLLKANKKNDTADLFLTGVKKKWQNAGVAVITFSEVQNALHNSGIDILETTGIFETNAEVINNWKNYDHKQHKRRRCYVKEIK